MREKRVPSKFGGKLNFILLFRVQGTQKCLFLGSVDCFLQFGRSHAPAEYPIFMKSGVHSESIVK